jgi:hypothetical protein
MTTTGLSLIELQRSMASAVMQPLTADERMQTRSVDGRDMNAVAASFIAPNSRLTACERLEIYNRQYWFRVLGALLEDFQGLRAVVGARAFQALSIAYLTEHPSRSFTLRNLGSQLPRWLMAHPEFAGRRHRLAVDIARIEWAFVEAFDNAEYSPLAPDQVATLDGSSRLALQPHLRLIALEYPADDLVLGLHKHDKKQTSEAGVSHDDSDDAPASLPRLRRHPTWLAAHRVDGSIYYLRLEREEFLILSALRERMPLGEAIETGFAESKITAAQRPRKIASWFATWAERAWLCAPELEDLME